MGTLCLQLALHGEEEKHDRFVRRRGAFQDLLAAARVAADADIRIDWVGWANKDNLQDLAPLRDRLRSIGRCVFGLSVVSCSGYAMEIEHLRVDDEDRRQLRADFGQNVLSHCRTESEWVDLALEGQTEEMLRGDPSSVAIYIDGQFGVWRKTTFERQNLGHLRADSSASIFQQYRKTIFPSNEIFKSRDANALIALARDFGNPHSTKLYRGPQAVRVWQIRKYMPEAVSTA